MGDESGGWLPRLTESAQRIRFAPGVIGKSTSLNISVGVVAVFALYKVSATNPWWLNAALLATPVLYGLYCARETRKMREYAVANPEAALMEGADYLAWRKFEAQSKHAIAGPRTPAVQRPNTALVVVDKPQDTTNDV